MTYMKQTLKLNKSLITRIFVLILIFFIAVSTCFGIFKTTAKADKEVDYTFYEVTNNISKGTSAIMEFYDTGESSWGNGDYDDKDHVKDGFLKGVANKTGNAGGLWGFSYKTEDASPYMLSFLSANVSTYDIGIMERFDKRAFGSGSGSSVNAAGSSYARYGYALSQLGVDHTTKNKDGGIINGIAGAILEGGYLLASAVGVLFDKLADALSALNPFKLLSKNFSQISGLSGGDAFSGPFIDTIAKYFKAIQSSALVCIILLFAFGLAFAFIKNGLSKDRGPNTLGKTIGFFILRLFFLLLAIPVCATAYTGLLDYLSSDTGEAVAAQDNAVCKTLVDFEYWVKLDRIAPPDGIKIAVDKKTGALTNKATSAKITAMYINSLVGHLDSKYLPPVDENVANNEIKAKEYSAKDSDKILEDTSGVLDMIRRYREGATLSPASYESTIKASISSIGDKEAIKALGQIGIKPDDKETEGIFFEDKDGHYYIGAKEKHILNNGYLGRKDGVYEMTESANGNKKWKDLENLNSEDYDDVYISSIGGLSSMAMYNYLNTTFASDSISVYSSKETSTEFGRQYHSSVAMAGSSMMDKFVGFLDCMAMLLAIAVIGIVYGLNIIIMSIRNGFRLIVSAPLAMIGSVRFIAKFITAFLVMIVEIVTTMLFYSIFCELLSISDTLFTINGNQAVSTLLQLVHMCLIVWITWFAIKNRRFLAKSVDEVLSDIGRKLTSVNGTPGAGPQAAAHAGAGATAGNTLAGGMDAERGSEYAGLDDMSQQKQAASEEGAYSSVNSGDGSGGDMSGGGAADSVGGESGDSDSEGGSSGTVSGDNSPGSSSGASPAQAKTGVNDMNNYSKSGAAKEGGSAQAVQKQPTNSSAKDSGASSERKPSSGGSARGKVSAVQNAASNAKGAVAGSAVGKGLASAADKAGELKRRAGRGSDANAARAQSRIKKNQATLNKHGITDMASYKDALRNNNISASEKENIKRAFDNVAGKSGINVGGRNVFGDFSTNREKIKQLNDLAHKKNRSMQENADMAQLKSYLRARNIPIESNGTVSRRFRSDYSGAMRDGRNGNL